MSKIAIDFGTTRTKVACLDIDTGKPKVLELGREIRSIIPSLFHISSEGEIQIGDDAVAASQYDHIGVVRGLKMDIDIISTIRKNKQKFSRIELASMLFSFIKEQCDSLYFHDDPVTECIITVPPSFFQNPVKRDAIIKAATLGGFDQIDTIEEPVAAAKHWLNEGNSSSQFIFVCDIGGGTTDFALLEKIADSEDFKFYTDLVPWGLDIGGNHIDESILEILDLQGLDARKQDAFLLQIRRFKETIRLNGKKCSIRFGKRRVDDLPEIIIESCEEFTVQLVLEIETFLKKVEKVESLDLAEAPLLLVGGGMHIYGLQASFDKIWPGKVIQWIDSEFATVCGAISKGNVDLPIKEAEESFQQALSLWNERLHGKTKLDDILTTFCSSEEVTELCNESLQRVDRFPPAFNLKNVLSREKNLLEEIEKAKAAWEKNEFDFVIQSCETAIKLYPKEDLPLSALDYYDEDLVTHLLLMKAEAYDAKYDEIKTIESLNKSFELLNNAIERKPELKSAYVLRAVVLIKILNVKSGHFNWSDVIDDIDTSFTLADDNWGLDNTGSTKTELLKYKAYAQYNQEAYQACVNSLQNLIKTAENNIKADEILYNLILVKVFYEAKEYTNSSDTIEHVFGKNYINTTPQFVNKIDLDLSLMLQWKDALSFSNPGHLIYWLLSSWIKCNTFKNDDDIARFYDLSSKVNDKPWRFNDGNLVQKNSDFMLSMARIAIAKGNKNQAIICLQELWVQFPFVTLAKVIANEDRRQLVKKEFVPAVTVTYDYGVLDNWVRICNLSPYALHDVELIIMVYYKNKTNKPRKQIRKRLSILNSKETVPPDNNQISSMNDTEKQQVRKKYYDWLDNVIADPGLWGRNIDDVQITVTCKEKRILNSQLIVNVFKA